MRSTCRSALLLALALSLLAGPALAQVKTFRKEVKQILGSAQSQDDARAAAVAKAKRDALEEAGMWLESVSEVRNANLVRDDVTALASGVTQTHIIEEQPLVEGGVFAIRVVAEVTVDNSGLGERVKRFLSDRQRMGEAQTLAEQNKRLLARLDDLERQMRNSKTASEQDRAAIRDAIEANSRDLKAREWFDKGYAALQNEQIPRGPKWKEAVEDFTQALRLAPNFLEAYINRGIAYQSLQQRQRAIEDYNQALRINPNSADAYANRGQIYFELGKEDSLRNEETFAKRDSNEWLQRALHDFAQAITLSPAESYLYDRRGRTYEFIGRHQSAVSDFDQSLLLDPGSWVVHVDRGDAYLAIGKNQLALLDYDQALKFEPQSFHAHRGRGQAFYGLGQFQRAIQEYDAEESQYGPFSGVGSYRANASAALAQLKRAIQDYDRIIADNPKNSKAYLSRGNANYGAGLADQASTDWQKACQLGEKDACDLVKKNQN